MMTAPGGERLAACRGPQRPRAQQPVAGALVCPSSPRGTPERRHQVHLAREVAVEPGASSPRREDGAAPAARPTRGSVPGPRPRHLHAPFLGSNHAQSGRGLGILGSTSSPRARLVVGVTDGAGDPIAHANVLVHGPSRGSDRRRRALLGDPRRDATEAPGEDKRAGLSPSAAWPQSATAPDGARAARSGEPGGPRDASAETSDRCIGPRCANLVGLVTRASELGKTVRVAAAGSNSSARPVARTRRVGVLKFSTLVPGDHEVVVGHPRSRDALARTAARNATRTRHIAHLFSRYAQKHDRSRFGGRRPGVTGRRSRVVLVTRENPRMKKPHQVRVTSFAEVQAVPWRAGCITARKACQQSDWKVHKKICGPKYDGTLDILGKMTRGADGPSSRRVASSVFAKAAEMMEKMTF